MDLVHKAKIIHNDLTPSNILLYFPPDHVQSVQHPQSQVALMWQERLNVYLNLALDSLRAVLLKSVQLLASSR